jgi:non-specific serine/threonine protein kinase/serine/threonine-protein kinase
LSTDRHARVKEIFLAACERTPEERAAYLNEACGSDAAVRSEVESLLEFHEDGTDLLRDSTDNGVAPSPTETPERITGYRILQQIGEGGMGVVYEAEQLEPVRRRVAVKVIKAGMDTKAVVARFESERQALAMMDHPNIARVYDAGTTEQGRPFFAMEYISGEPITRYCDRHRLETRERLALFTQLCDGVQHAHHKGVIHRDIKPSNVLVRILDDRPVPTIIDFGIAKATQHRLTEKTMLTATGVLIGTPEYMSPEQAEMTGLDVDTRTDVYALGVMLYELLVGALPFDSGALREAGSDEIRRRIREDEPSKPSTKVTTLGEATTGAAERRRTDPRGLRRLLKGDLDWITMKALEKDRDRRYTSPAEMAADIERHLRHEPVLAGPPGLTYRTQKFVRRHRVGVAAGSALLAVLLISMVGTTITLVQAERKARTAQRVSMLLTRLFEDLNSFAAGEKAGDTEEILDRAAQRIQTELAGEPLMQAQVLSAVGRAYQGTGRPDAARRLFDKSLNLRRDLLGEDHPEVALSMSQLGEVLFQIGEYEQARRLHEQALDFRREFYGPDHQTVAWSLHSLGVISWRASELETARSLLRQSLEIEERIFGPDSMQAAVTLPVLAGVEMDRLEYQTAREHLQRTLRIRESTLGPDHFYVVEALSELGRNYVETGDAEAALPLLERAAEIVEKVGGPEHPSLTFPLQIKARALNALRDYDASRELFERTLQIQEQQLGLVHQDIAYTLRAYGVLLGRMGDIDGARQAFERALAIIEEKFGADHLDTARILHALGYLEYQVGNYERSRQCNERALEIRRKVYGPAHRGLNPSLYALACLAALGGERERTLELLHEALECGYARSFIFDDPDFDALRSDPEFEAVLDEVRSRQGTSP